MRTIREQFVKKLAGDAFGKLENFPQSDVDILNVKKIL